MTPHLADAPVLETERLILRAPDMRDWPAFEAFMTSDRSRFVRPPEVDRRLAWRAFGHWVGHWILRGFGQFILEDRATGASLGAVGNWYPEGWPEREVGWMIFAPEAEGKGYAAEAARAVLGHTFGTLGWNTAVSYIDPENAGSIALAQRLGATLDPAARTPHPEESLLVYRHAGPEGAA
ncbi:GNAT family N-acetyltransferase [Acidimangrovimonas sediminis]|uniref:GNAT family N-acetyltransferase n=1 Tax=Acidimangrovimonas sediminis TaxID=2056283 RepID=UPI000C7FA936|nr:GNAT family N-acetyltransferase [Acidimangrovimonas sediminis]